MYKIAIVGSRTFTDYEFMKQILDAHKDKIALIISGGADGADTLAQRYAKENAIPIHIYYPDWKNYGKRAGFRRNVIIANLAEKMIAFWDGKSKGTKHSIDKMKQLGKPIVVIQI